MAASASAAALVVSLLQASSKHPRDLSATRKLHRHVVEAGFLANPRVGSALVNAYAACGALAEAAETLLTLPARTLIAWTALIAGYARFGPHGRALDCFHSMRIADGFSPDSFAFVCALTACGCLRDLDSGCRLHAEITCHGFLFSHVFVGNALVDMYAKCGALGKALETFDGLSPLRDLSSWNVMISAYARCQHRCGGDDYDDDEEEEEEEDDDDDDDDLDADGCGALACFYRMQSEGFAADLITFVGILRACACSGSIRKGQEIHARFRLIAEKRHIPVTNTLMDMYAKCGLIPEAQRIFDGLPLRDGISWNVIISAHARHGHGREALHLFDCMHSEGFFPDALTLIGALKACGIVGALDKGREIQAEIVKEEWTRKHDSVGNALVDMYSKCGSIEEARDVFDELPFRNVSSWNALISGYGHHDRAEEALQCFELMQSAGASPDSVTFVCILKACGRVGAMEMGQRVHAEIVSQGLLRHSRVGHGVVDMYAKCGAMAEAQEAFDGLMLQDAVPWNSLLLGYAQLGDDGSVFELFDKMMGTQAVEPDSITFLVILYLCSHSGLVLWGEICFDTMITGYGIVPTLQHCNCMIDLYARAGHLQLVMEIIEEMPFHGNLVSRRSVLSSFC